MDSKQEKVIKGLESFKDDLKPFAGNSADWKKVDDAIDLLKAQAPHDARLLTADEVQHLQDRQTICIEQLVSRSTDKHGYVTGCAWGVMCNKNNSPEDGLLVSMLGTFFPNTITKIPYEAMFQREDEKGHYIVPFRFWLAIPPTN